MASVQVWNCQLCGVRCEREPVRGTRPKWCGPRCAGRGKNLIRGVCEGCGTAYAGQGERFCSKSCASSHPRSDRPKRKTRSREELQDLWRSQRSDLRASYEDGDTAGYMLAVKGRASITEDGCWRWSGAFDRHGYPRVKLGKRTFMVHRMVAEMKFGAAMKSQHSHHICGNSYCVNPDHIVPATAAANVAEMLARTSYENRIHELEEALALLAPSHPLLGVIPLK